MQQSRWERLAPLTGVVAVAIIIAVFSIGGSTPDEHDSASKVWAYYSRHHDKQIALAFILAIALPFLVFFASTLRHELRRAGGTGQLSTAAFGGGVLAAAGFGLLSTVHIALSSAGERVATQATVQTLNVLDNNDFVPAVAGVALLVLAAGLSVVRHGGLPRWLGWVAIVLGRVHRLLGRGRMDHRRQHPVHHRATQHWRSHAGRRGARHDVAGVARREPAGARRRAMRPEPSTRAQPTARTK